MEQSEGPDNPIEALQDAIARKNAALQIALHRIAKIEGMARGICAMDDAGYGIKSSSVEGIYKEASEALVALAKARGD